MAFRTGISRTGARAVWVVLVAAILASCTVTAPTPAPGGESSPSAGASPGADGSTLPDSTAAPSGASPSGAPPGEAVSSQELIAADLAADLIDEPTSFLYRAYALFGDERLPERYWGTIPAPDEHLFSEIARAEPMLPPEVVEALIPFTVRPHDPRSIHTPDGSLADGIVRLAATTAQASIVCQPDGWAHLTSPKGLKVWATCGTYDDAEFDDSDYDQRIRDAYTALERVWDAETALMGRPIPDVTASMSPAKVVAAGADGSIDFYLVQRWQCIRREGVCRSLRGPAPRRRIPRRRGRYAGLGARRGRAPGRRICRKRIPEGGRRGVRRGMVGDDHHHAGPRRRSAVAARSSKGRSAPSGRPGRRCLGRGR